MVPLAKWEIKGNSAVFFKQLLAFNDVIFTVQLSWIKLYMLKCTFLYFSSKASTKN